MAEEPEARPETERGLERVDEARRYTAVIVKRNDEWRRHPDDTLEHAIEEGAAQVDRRVGSLLLSAIAAGLILGFSAMAVAVMAALVGPVEGMEAELQRRLWMAVVYPLGFVVVVLSGTELFTEQTATAMYPVLDGRRRPAAVLRVWSVVLLGNLLGAAVAAALLVAAEPVVHAAPGYAVLAHHLTDFAVGPLFVSSLLAGWLMGLAGWLVLSSPPDVSQLASIYIATFLIGLGGLHHSIAGAVEAFVGVLYVADFGVLDALGFLAVAVPGNLVGGAVFVAALNYGHIRRSRAVDDDG